MEEITDIAWASHLCERVCMWANSPVISAIRPGERRILKGEAPDRSCPSYLSFQQLLEGLVMSS